MLRVRIPGQLPNSGDLRVIIHIGTLGFTRSEVFLNKDWKPGGIIYIDPDTIKCEFEIIDRPNSRISAKLKEILAPIEKNQKNSKKSQKNAQKA